MQKAKRNFNPQKAKTKNKMKAKLKPSVERLFTPEFHTSIGGQSVRLTRKDLVRNWPKYIRTSASSVYENLEELRSKAKSLKGKVAGVTPELLDMKKANSRGTSFSQPTQKQKTASAVKAFQAKQKRNIDRLKASNKAQKDREKKLIESTRRTATRKAKKDAEKTSA